MTARLVPALLLALVVATPFGACAAPPSQHLLSGHVPSYTGISGTTSSTGADAGSSTPSTIDAPAIPPDIYTTLKPAADAHAELCASDPQHPNFPDDADLVTKTFCQDLKDGGVMPTPHSLADLQVQLGLDFKDPNGGNGTGGNPAFAILGHSSALTARKISSIAPTAFIFTPPPPDGTKPPGAFIALGFDPGEEFVEIASYDPTVGQMNFYLVIFNHACTSATPGCTADDLLTPKLVTGWIDTWVYEDTSALGDTILDCHVCHQSDNAAAPFLRMQESEAPFTHWFSASTVGGRALLADFHAAHGTTEDYGGIPAALIDKSDPSKLAAFVLQAGSAHQPNPFPSAQIEAEVTASALGQPVVNDPPGTSASWEAVYAPAVAGEFIAAPYHDVKVTDAQKLASMTSAYQAWLGNGNGTPLVPDIRDVFADADLRDMGFAPKLGLDGRGTLVQMCQECHNANLDPTETREKFLVDSLDQMSRAEKDLAITRLNDSLDTRLRMPPPLFRTITDDEREAMITELQK